MIPGMRRQRVLRGLLALLPAALLAAALYYTGALGSLHQVVLRVAPGIWLLALAGQMLSYSARAVRLMTSERGRYRDRFWTCLRLILVNNALNLALPLRTGEASFPLLLRRWFGVDLAQASGTLIWMRLLDLQVLALAALISVQALHAVPGGAAWRAAMLALCAAPVLLWAAQAPLLRNLGDGRIAGIARRVLAGMPSRLPTLLQAWLWTLASWGVKLAVLGQLLAALIHTSAPVGVLGAIGADLSTVLPLHAPGGFGSFEAALIAFVGAYVKPGTELLAAALAFHLFVLGFALLAGIAAWLSPGMPRPIATTEKGLPS
ncbi:MAG: rane protein [Hydrocarboniphaga sp.]|uniref:lysylphosphatidylglycerol synthase transmembrane domain-containing protein n=1 Tax=Hydrocarboniphaga sp. TaxID=2033016 RepID=UPI0026260826|nr:lysylphosphatidylglycerol synthase transmembrane domain-containing protein [Hydrocarboniphaga sp.]MDB5972760.1 rane protein [Hydrocarboniphaga sp.]